MRSLIALSALSAVSAATIQPALRFRGGFSPPSTAVAVPRGPAAGHSELTASTPLFMGIDFALLFYFAGWYLGNYYYTLNNKLALKAAGGAAGFPITIGFLQMVIGSLYALFLWMAPDARVSPNISASDLVKILPVAACAGGAHLSSIFSMNLGAVSFAQIVKAAEPAFAALLGVSLYGKSVSRAKWLCLIPVIGGVCLASIQELDFSVMALVSACVANLFAAFRSNENKKLMDTPGLRERIGSTGNQATLLWLRRLLLWLLCIMMPWLLLCRR